MGRGRAKVKVIDRDRGLKKLLAMVRKLKGAKKVTAGLHDDAAAIDYGYVHEFGGTRVPTRSFLRATFDANRSKYERMMEVVAQEILDGKASPDEALARVAEEFVKDVQAAIVSLGLVDTGDLHNSIEHRKK